MNTTKTKKDEYQRITPTITKTRSAVRKTIKKLGITNKDIILLAISGGADSMALALATHHVATKLSIPTHTVTVDHNIRDNSYIEAKEVEQKLQQIGYKNTHVVSINLDDIETKNSLGPEGNARLGRYEAIKEIAQKITNTYPINKDNSEDLALISDKYQRKCYVFTAHTMNDQAETVLLRLSRGAGIKSLSAIAEYTQLFGLNMVRPFLEITRQETEQCCHDHNTTFIIDETNYLDSTWTTANGSPLLRVAIRHKVIPALNEALQQNTVNALSRTAILARKDNEALEFIADKYFEKLWVNNPKNIDESNKKNESKKTVEISRTANILRPSKMIRRRPAYAVMTSQPTENLQHCDTKMVDVDFTLRSASPAFANIILHGDQTRELPEAIRTRVYLKALEKNGYPLTAINSKHLVAIDNLVMTSDNKSYIEIVGANKITITSDGLVIPQYTK